MTDGNGSGQNEIAAVDRLQQTINAAVRALDANVAAVMSEALNFLAGTQSELAQLNKRIEAARSQLSAARQEWERGGSARVAPPVPLADDEIGPVAPPAFLQKPIVPSRN